MHKVAARTPRYLLFPLVAQGFTTAYLASTRRNQHRGRAVDHPPGGSQADPPGVSTHATGPPVFDVAVEPGAPQGIPIAGRVSSPVEGVGVVGVVGDGECGVVVCATVVCVTVVCGGADEVTGGVVVAANDGVVVGGVVTTGVGALTMGGGMAVVGARRAGGTVVSGVGVSTSLGAS